MRITKIKPEHCVRCAREIEDKESYLVLQEFNNGKMIRENKYHYDCWEDKFSVKKMAFGLYGKVNKMLDKFGGEEGEVFEVEQEKSKNAT